MNNFEEKELASYLFEKTHQNNSPFAGYEMARAMNVGNCQYACPIKINSNFDPEVQLKMADAYMQFYDELLGAEELPREILPQHEKWAYQNLFHDQYLAFLSGYKDLIRLVFAMKK